MPEKFLSMLTSIPFMMILSASDRRQIRMNWARILEAAIFAVIGGLLAGYVSVKVLESKMLTMEHQVDKIETLIIRHIETQNGNN